MVRKKKSIVKEREEKANQDIAQNDREESQKEMSKADLKKQQNQFYWIIGTMAGIIIVFLLVFSAIQKMNNFEYEGLSFTRERIPEFDNLIVYHHTYLLQNRGGQLFQYNLYLRNDPRENDIPIDEGRIEFSRDREIYFSVDSSGINDCPQGILAAATLSGFLTNNLNDITIAVPNEELAAAQNLTFADCESVKEGEVIILQQGREETGTRVIKPESMCYIIEVTNCEVLEAVEKFMTQAIIDAKNRAELINKN